MNKIRIGHGYDVHRLVKERKLILGGVEIEHELGLDGHSDADVLTHAVMDALLGAAGLKDIGQYFSPLDDKYKGADSLKLLSAVMELIQTKSFSIVNIDSTLMAQRPKLESFIQTMRENIARTCNINTEQVNVKATTTEKLGFCGREEGIAASAVCLLEKNG